MIRIVPLGVSLSERSRYDVANWALLAAGSVGPVQAILLSGRADNFLGVVENAASGPIFFGVVILRLDIAAADFNRVQFIAADSARQDFLLSMVYVEIPLAAHLNNWNRKRPVVLANQE